MSRKDPSVIDATAAIKEFFLNNSSEHLGRILNDYGQSNVAAESYPIYSALLAQGGPLLPKEFLQHLQDYPNPRLVMRQVFLKQVIFWIIKYIELLKIFFTALIQDKKIMHNYTRKIPDTDRGRLIWYQEFASNLDQCIMREVQIHINRYYGLQTDHPIAIALFQYRFYHELVKCIVDYFQRSSHEFTVYMGDEENPFALLELIQKGLGDVSHGEARRVPVRLYEELEKAVDSSLEFFAHSLKESLLEKADCSLQIVICQLRDFFGTNETQLLYEFLESLSLDLDPMLQEFRFASFTRYLQFSFLFVDL